MRLGAQALLMPIGELTALCRARGIVSLVDGAHGLGATPLHLSPAPRAGPDAHGWGGGADYYVGNCHKWFSAPRGAAFLRVNRAALAAAAPEVPQPLPPKASLSCPCRIRQSAGGGIG